MAEAPRTIAVFDVGKTNVKVAIVDRVQRRELDRRVAPNIVATDDLYPHYNVEAIWGFLGSSMTELAQHHRIEGVAVAAHGASIVVLGDNDLALPILDYEHDGPDACWDAYNAIRPEFSETLSPRLPKGLTVGAQLYWLQETFPDRFANARAIVTYPQYWTWRLTGRVANEMTSVGCHTDLWNHDAGRWSSLAKRRGWLPLMAPLHPATEPQGRLLPALAGAWGLPEGIPVAGGLHDSNASIVPHLLERPQPFSVVSSGTWAITFGIGAEPVSLDERRDILANINVFGERVPSARFMGGREFELLTGAKDANDGGEGALDRILRDRIAVQPAVVSDSGHFPGLAHAWSDSERNLTPGERHCAASLYLALMSKTSVDLIAGVGPTVVEGPFTANGIYLRALATLTGRQVLVPEQTATGTSIGAALMFELQNAEAERGHVAYRAADPFAGDFGDQLKAYGRDWRETAERRWAERTPAADSA